MRVMQGAPERKNGDDGLPVPPYAVYNIGGSLSLVTLVTRGCVSLGVEYT